MTDSETYEEVKFRHHPSESVASPQNLNMQLGKRHASFDTLAGGVAANNFKMKQSPN